MRLRLKAFKHQRPHVFTCMLPRRLKGHEEGRVIKLKSIGDVSDDLPESVCYEIAGAHPGCLEVIKDDKELQSMKKSISASPKNK